MDRQLQISRQGLESTEEGVNPGSGDAGGLLGRRRGLRLPQGAVVRVVGGLAQAGVGVMG